MRISCIIETPWPPSVNHYLGRRGSRTFKKKAAIEFLEEVRQRANTSGIDFGYEGKVRVVIYVFPPDNRRRDIDNLSKVALDSLVFAGIIKDDSQVHDLRIVRLSHQREGRLIIYIEGMEGC